MKKYDLLKVLLFLFLFGLILLLFGQTIRVPTNPYPYDIVDYSGQMWKWVNVCNESLKLPTESCPVIIKKLFKYPDGLPTEVCDIHKPAIPQLTYTVKYIKEKTDKTIYLVPFLLPALFINKDYSNADYEDFIDRLIEIDGTNTLRVFSAGVWEPETVNQMIYPFKKVGDKFDLNQINPVWLDQTIDRIRYFVERGGTIIYTLIDGCSLHYAAAGHWTAHWWNGDKNINGTNPDRRAMIHMFHWRDSKTAITRRYVLKFMVFMVDLLEQEFPGSIVYDFNEFPGDVKTYIGFDNKVFKKFNIPRERKTFSYVGWDRYSEVHLLVDRYIFQPHGICSWQNYLDEKRRKLSNQPVMYSADGCEMLTAPVVEQIVYDALISGSHGFENNRNWMPLTSLEDQINYNTVFGFRRALIKWLYCYN